MTSEKKTNNITFLKIEKMEIDFGEGKRLYLYDTGKYFTSC